MGYYIHPVGDKPRSSPRSSASKSRHIVLTIQLGPDLLLSYAIPPQLSSLQPVSVEVVELLLARMPDKTSRLDEVPTRVIKWVKRLSHRAFP